jgi:biotin carboxyl carrier protein
MRCRIHLMGHHHEVTLLGRPEAWRLQFENEEPRPASLSLVGSGESLIRLGDHSARIQLRVKGEMAYIRAFGRTFTLCVVDPVEQAAQETGGRANTARAPMPGVVVEIKVAVGDRVIKAQPLIVIESMKILTVIAAPRDGEVARIHFEPGQSFDKNAPLITLDEKEET